MKLKPFPNVAQPRHRVPSEAAGKPVNPKTIRRDLSGSVMVPGQRVYVGGWRQGGAAGRAGCRSPSVIFGVPCSRRRDYI